MTRLFLAAGVAALAIAGAAAAKPGGGHGGGGGGNPHGGGGGPPPQQQHGGGGGGGGHGGGNPHFQAFGGGGGGHGHGGGGPRFQAFERGGGHGRGHGGGFAAPQMQRFAMPREHGHGGQRFAIERPQRQFRMERQARNRGFERQQFRMEREARNRGFERQQMRIQRQAQNRAFERQQMRGNAFRQMQAQNHRGFDRQQMRMERFQQAQKGDFDRQRFQQQQQAFAGQQFDRNRFDRSDREFRVNEQFASNYWGSGGRALANGCPPGLWAKNNGCMPPGQAAKLIGAPLQAAASFAPLYALPASISYLYPDTPDYYYRYGDGYLYEVDRDTNLIDNLVPLLAGGYLPGQYLPQPYMASYVPDYYDLNSFYPDYGDVCNRYGNGVVYEVDCETGMVEDVIPLYAGGYGVGQMLPASYAYYNVPYQYRSMYYDTPEYNYWYAPGAIYQYDPRSSMITSVAALLSPGFTVGQPLPVGYDVYNVPYGYRSTYYDTPNAWYRYSNGYIYQVDPVTRLVTAIVASILT